MVVVMVMVTVMVMVVVVVGGGGGGGGWCGGCGVVGCGVVGCGGCVCWPILGLCWPNLDTFWALCWAMLSHLEPQDRKNGKRKNYGKNQGVRGSAVGGARPFLLRRRRCRTAKPRPVGAPLGPWPDLRAYAPQPARGPTKGKGEGAGGVGAVEWVRGAVL